MLRTIHANEDPRYSWRWATGPYAGVGCTPLSVRVCTFDQTVDACAGQMTPLWVGCFDDVAALRDFVTRVGHRLRL